MANASHHLAAPAPCASARATVEASGIAVRRGGLPVILDATFAIGPGLWLLQGPNGSGKSTLLRVMAGVGSAWRGRLRICGHDLQDAPVLARQNLGYAPQSAELLGYLTVREFLETVAALRGTSAKASLDRARAWIHDACAQQRMDTLSAGQRRKLCLCAALSGHPRVLLLDEPETGLDTDSVAALRDELAGIARRGHVVIISSHRDLDAPDVLAGVLNIADGQVRRHHGPGAPLTFSARLVKAVGTTSPAPAPTRSECAPATCGSIAAVTAGASAAAAVVPGQRYAHKDPC